MVGLFSDSIDFRGVRVHQHALTRSEQEGLIADLRTLASIAPFQRYETPGGRKLSVRMTAAGALGWMSDRKGYRYTDQSPQGQKWPDIPPSILDIWRRFAGIERDPDSCLVNFYGEGARMGMHQDRNEADASWPVLSVSLGDDALFRVGGVREPTPSQSLWLKSGDVAVLEGQARLAFHGIDRIRFKSSNLLPDGGRVNLTLRIAG